VLLRWVVLLLPLLMWLVLFFMPVCLLLRWLLLSRLRGLTCL
jgi:hypothetical protein